MTKITQRQMSIKKIVLLYESIPYRGGDWDDVVSDFSQKMPPIEQLPGITREEYSVLSCGDTAPRACSEMVEDLFEEIDGISFPDDSARKQLKGDIQKLREMIKILDKMYTSTDPIVDSFFTTGGYEKMEDLRDSSLHFEWEDFKEETTEYGVIPPRRKLTIKLDLEIRQCGYTEDSIPS